MLIVQSSNPDIIKIAKMDGSSRCIVTFSMCLRIKLIIDQMVALILIM
jgi:hypothetical protein